MHKRAGMCYDKGNFTKGKNRQMLGRTHFFIGTAAALAVLQPQTVPALVAGAGAAAIGGLISDIDVGTSQAHRDADKLQLRCSQFLRSIN